MHAHASSALGQPSAAPPHAACCCQEGAKESGVFKASPQSLLYLALHQPYGCRGCSPPIRGCRAQSRNLPGNQAPSDGGATRLSGGDATALAGEGPSVRDYLEFGRLLGERPDTVKQRLEAAGGYPASDDDAEDYLRQCVMRPLHIPSS